MKTNYAKKQMKNKIPKKENDKNDNDDRWKDPIKNRENYEPPNMKNMTKNKITKHENARNLKIRKNNMNILIMKK